MRLTRGRVSLTALLGAALVMGAVAPVFAQTSTPSATDEKVVFNVGVDSDITSLNPYNLCCGPDYEYLTLIYNIGIGFADDLSPAPQLVTEWTPSEDHMTWTLKVRDDAVWHDGQPVTAEDIAFSFRLVADNAMPFYKDYLPFEPTFTVVDNTTIEWSSTKPTFAPEVPPYIPIVPEHIWSELVTPGDAKETKKTVKEFKNNPPIGSGPFRFVEWEKGQYLRMEANPDYWGGTPASIDELYLRVYSSQEAMAQALRQGEIDFADGLSPSLFNTLASDPAIKTHVADGGCWGNIAFNFGGQGDQETHHPAIEDVTVRQAVATGIDKQAIVDKVYQGTATIGDSILMPGSNGFWYHDIPAELEFAYDPAKANQMLDDAGYLDTDGDGVREMPDGSDPLIWEFMTISDVNGSVDTGKLLRSYMADIGIKVEFITVNTNKAYDLWYTGEWDVYVWDWCPDPDPDFMLSVFSTDQCLGWSDGCYSNPEYDALYEEQKTLLDRDERKATIDQMQEMVAEELPAVVLNYWSDLQAYRADRFEGYVLSPAVDNGLLLFGWNNESYMNLVPVSDEAAAEVAAASSSGIPTWVWAAILVGAVVVIGGIVMARRKSSADDEEI